jgi:hypothetical protein
MGLTEDDLLVLRDAISVPEQYLREMEAAADPANSRVDSRVTPVRTYKLTVATATADRVVEPALRAFAHRGLEFLAENPDVPGFDEKGAALVAALSVALAQVAPPPTEERQAGTARAQPQGKRPKKRNGAGAATARSASRGTASKAPGTVDSTGS